MTWAFIPPPNYSDPPSLKNLVLGAQYGTLPVALLFVVLRIWARKSILGRLLPEDWLIMFSLLISIFMSFCCHYSVLWLGVGRHHWDIPKYLQFKAPFQFPRATYANAFAYWIVIIVIKLSIIILYLRLSPSRRFQWACYAAIAFIVGTGGGLGLALSFPCVPPAANFDYELLATAKCLNPSFMARLHAIFHTIGDIVVLVLPLPILIKARLPRTQKMHVLIVFLLGGIVTLVSLARIYFVFVAENNFFRDYSWHGARTMAVSAIEVNLGIVCASLPAVKNGLGTWFPKLFGSFSQVQSVGEIISSNMGGRAPHVSLHLERSKAETVDLEGDSDSDHTAAYHETLSDIHMESISHQGTLKSENSDGAQPPSRSDLWTRKKEGDST